MVVKNKPLFIFDGNCQAHHLASILLGGGLADAVSIGGDYGFLPSYKGRISEFISEDEAYQEAAHAKSIGKKVYQASQSTQLSAQTEHKFTPIVDKVLKFPYIQAHIVKPQRFYDIFPVKLSLKRIFDLDVSMLKTCQTRAESNFDFAALVKEQFPKTPLMHTFSHPNGLLISHLFRMLTDQVDDFQADDITRVERDLSDKEGLNFVTDHPLSSTELEELGFDWPDWYPTYRDLLNAEISGEWSHLRHQLWPLYEQFANDSSACRALIRGATAAKDRELHEKVARRFCQMSPGFVHSWLLLYDYHLEYGQPEDLEEVIMNAKAFFGANRIHSFLSAWIEIKRNNLGLANDYALDYLDRTPDRTEAIMPLLQILIQGGNVESARETARSYARSRNVKDLHDLMSNLSAFGELGISQDELKQLMGA